MDAIELKFLLKLLAVPDYRAPLSNIKPTDKTKASERERICGKLRDRELVDCAYEVTKLKITPPGQELLKLDSAELPLTDRQLKVLRTCEKEAITPGKIKIPVAERQAIIQGLADKGLIELETKIKEVWLSERGKEFLREEYTAKGTNPILSLDMLTSYLRFLRKSLHVETSARPKSEPATAQVSEPTDEEILQTIRNLDRQLGTDNYLPIFHLRQKLQPPLSREQLDQSLYRLQRNDQIELSSLQEAIAYTPEQIDAGIPQDIGGPLFFIAVN